MRINEILTEAYLDTITAKHAMGGSTKNVEVFVQPQRKEIQEIPALYGYRLLADLHNQKFYACDGNAIHADMWDGLNLNGNYVDIQKGLQTQYFTFSSGQYTGKQFVQLESDTFTNEIFFYAVRESDEHKQMILANINKMLEYDWNWMSRWCNPQEAKQIVIDLKQQFEDDLQYASA